MIETKTTKEVSILHQNYRDYDDIIWVGLESLKKEILQRKNTENELRTDLERSKLCIKNDLDPKDKAFSNDDKREVYVCELPLIKNKIDELKKYKYDTDMLEIDLRFNLRQLDICIHYLKMDVNIQ